MKATNRHFLKVGTKSEEATMNVDRDAVGMSKWRRRIEAPLEMVVLLLLLLSLELCRAWPAVTPPTLLELRHALVQSPIRPHSHRRLNQFIAGIFIIFNKVAVAKKYECQKYEKIIDS